MATTTQLRIAPAARASALGAVCLDGSPPAYWYQPPRPQAATDNASWLIHLDGGAWCYDERDCAGRARGDKGSSAPLKRRYWPYSGLMDGSAAVNPTFAGFHRVNLAYCDGGSFTGDRAEPVVLPSGEKLYFRGRRVLRLLIDELLAAGLRHARRLLWVGGSAGGPGALHAATQVRQRVGPQLEAFKVVMVSGWFLLRPPATPGLAAPGSMSSASASAAASPSSFTSASSSSSSSSALATSSSLATAAEATSCAAAQLRPKERAACLPWAEKMRSMVALHNSTGAASPACLKAFPPAEQWRCFFPRHAAARLVKRAACSA